MNGLSGGRRIKEILSVTANSIVVWSRNGIEFYYPPSLIDKIFGAGAEISIQGDIVSRNGMKYSKADLADRVVAGLTPDTPMHPDFEKVLLQTLENQIQIRR